MRQKENLLLIIDPQRDFCEEGGALFVQGSVEDSLRTSEFIKNNIDDISNVIVTLDSHHIVDISHPSWWVDAEGNQIPPFTPISYEDVESGKYTTSIEYELNETKSYLKKLECQGEFGHFVWPEHCIVGEYGWLIEKQIGNALSDWERKSLKNVMKEMKGENPTTEHFGAIRANVPKIWDEKTGLNKTIISELIKHDKIYICGQARDYCVVNTLKQILEETHDLADRIVVLEDCMSNVGASQEVVDIADRIYEAARERGVRFKKSTDINLKTVEA